MSDRGYVYILTNKSFKENWVKIGKSSRMPEVRGKELYNTAVPLPYEVYATLKTVKYNEAEQLIHKSIDRISNLRISPNREFFNIPPEKAYEIFLDIATMLDDAEVELHNEETLKPMTKLPTKHSKDKFIKKSNFDFYSRGIKNGDEVCFIKDKNIIAVVISSTKVSFENNIWSLSALARELFTRMHQNNNSGAYQGPAFFTFNGIKLTELPIHQEEGSNE